MAIDREPKEGEVTEGNLGCPLYVTGEPERSEGNLGFPLYLCGALPRSY
jgi:hypothetical protein